jgi:hypothetical protein
MGCYACSRMAFKSEEYGKWKVTKAFGAIRETQKEATEAPTILVGDIVEAVANFTKTDEEYVRFKWKNANYHTLETVFRANAEPVPVEKKS